MSASETSPLDRAIKIVGSQTALAHAVGVVPMAVTLWKKRGVPAIRCIPIEQATGGQVTRYELRSDVFGPPPSETGNESRSAIDDGECDCPRKSEAAA